MSLADDIKLNLAATDIRIEAPIPGKAAVGIEVPNKESKTVTFRELIENEEFKTMGKVDYLIFNVPDSKDEIYVKSVPEILQNGI